MRWASQWVALVVGIGALAAFSDACSFDARSDDYVCSPERDCPAGRVCVDGWCVVSSDPSDSGPNDASSGDSAPAVDGAQLPDALAIDAAIDCPNGDCGPLEDPGNCPDDCATCEAFSAGTCTEACGGAGAYCYLSCPSGSCTCAFDCTLADNCEGRCDDGTSCAFDCTNATDCNRVRCLGGAQCRLYCTGAESCGFSQCTGGSGPVSCSDGVACNRDC